MKANDRTGETVMAKCGKTMTVFAYWNNMDIDVQFEDGVIVRHKAYGNFKKGNIAHPEVNGYRKKGEKDIEKHRNMRVGEVKTASNNTDMEIIAYRGYNDIDVQFEDGTIVKHTSYRQFKDGCIENRNLKASDLYWERRRNEMKDKRIGEEGEASNGLAMKILDYRSCDDMDVEFEDGYIAEHVKYHLFKKGYVPHPKSARTIENKNRALSLKEKRIGEESVSKNGLKMKIIEYQDCFHTGVEFDDGTIVNTSYDQFKKGTVRNPNFTKEDKIRAERMGKEFTGKDGSHFIITAYRNSHDLDIEFDDGTVLEHIRYSKIGDVIHPDNRKSHLSGNTIKAKMGEVKMANCGLMMKIKEYRSSTDMDISFEDGHIRHSISYSSFKKGSVTYYDDNRSLVLTNLYGFPLQGIAYRWDDRTFWYVMLPGGEKKIMTARMMNEYRKQLDNGVKDPAVEMDNKERDPFDWENKEDKDE